MPDRIALPVLALLATGLIALALVWPQGQGAASPAPFGHPLEPLPAPLAAAKPNEPKSRVEAPPPASGPPRRGDGQAAPEALRGPESASDRP